MIRWIWWAIFGGCLHTYKWEQVRYANCIAQRGVCSKCGYTKEKTIGAYEGAKSASTPT